MVTVQQAVWIIMVAAIDSVLKLVSEVLFLFA